MRPKFEIIALTHDHIDGSKAVLDIYPQLCELSGIPPEQRMTPKQIVTYFADVHSDLVAKFSFSTSLLQTREALQLMGYAYGKRRAEEGYSVVEGQFAPQYHLTKGMTVRMVIHEMLQGLRRAEVEFGIRIVPVVCIGREATPEQGEAIARAVLHYGGEVALGLACVEPGNPPEKHLPAFRLTFGTKVRRTVHAGEWVEDAPVATYRQRLNHNVRTAVRTLKCHDVGHAIALCDDDELIREVVDRGVRVSGCPLSNKTLGKIQSVRDLRIDKLLDAGVLYTLNPDDDLFLPDMNAVIAECLAEYEFTFPQRQALCVNPLLTTFD